MTRQANLPRRVRLYFGLNSHRGFLVLRKTRTSWRALALFIVSASFAFPALCKDPKVNFPSQLHGVWELGFEPCKLPGNLDSDGRIEIKAQVLEAYEDHSVPVETVRVSSSPLAWRITYLLHIDEFTEKNSAIYALNGSRTLTIVDKSKPSIYSRCT